MKDHAKSQILFDNDLIIFQQISSLKKTSSKYSVVLINLIVEIIILKFATLSKFLSPYNYSDEVS